MSEGKSFHTCTSVRKVQHIECMTVVEDRSLCRDGMSAVCVWVWTAEGTAEHQRVAPDKSNTRRGWRTQILSMRNHQHVTVNKNCKSRLNIDVETDRAARSATYKLNKTGPSTEPWGTLQIRGTADDREAPQQTNCVRAERYDLNQPSRNWSADPFPGGHVIKVNSHSLLEYLVTWWPWPGVSVTWFQSWYVI